MAATTLVDLVKILSLSSGTGPFSLGSAVPGFRGTEALVDGATYSYSVQSGSNYEAGQGVYLSSTSTLVRTPLTSSRGNATVPFEANVQISFTALAQDFAIVSVIAAAEAAGSAAGTAAAEAGLAGITAEVSALSDSLDDKVPYSGGTLTGPINVPFMFVIRSPGEGGKFQLNKPLTTSLAGNVTVGISSDDKFRVFEDGGTSRGFYVDLLTMGAGASTNLLGFTQAGTGAVASTLQKKAREVRSIQDFGGVVDGATDDRAALALADAQGSVRINGRVRLSSSITLANLPEITPNGGFLLDSGVVLTFPAGFSAPRKQVFYGAGTVAGLTETWLEWFDGDSVTFAPTLPSVNVRPLIQKAINATVVGCVVRAEYGQRAIDGVPIDLSGRSFEGAGFSPHGTVLYFNGTSRNGFHLIGSFVGGSVEGVRFDCINASVPPVTGAALYTTQSETTFKDIETVGAYVGAYFKSMVIGRSDNVRHNDALISPVQIEDSLDVFIDNWNHSALGDLVTFTGTPSGGAFAAGETVTCTTGSTGIVQAVFTPTIYRIQWYGVRPPVSSTVTATGKSATVSSVVVSHQLGSIRFVSTAALCEGNSVGAGDSVGGELGLVVAGTGTSGRSVGNVGDIYIAPDALFDVSYGGSQIDSGYDFQIFGRYASSRDVNAPGLALNACTRVSGEPRGVNNAGAGIQWGADSTHIHIKAKMDGNCRNYTLPDMAEVRLTGAVKNWSIIGGLVGFPGLNGGADPILGLYVPAAADDFKVIGLDAPNAKITNLSTGTNQFWSGVSGMVDRAPARPQFADDAEAAAGSLPLNAFYRTLSAIKQRIT